MSHLRHLFSILIICSLASCILVGCGHRADLKHPTVAQADDMDVQWGLPRRKARGGPKQFFQSRTAAAAAAGFSGDAAPAAAAPASAAPAAAPAPAPAAAQPSVNVPANLR